MVPDAVTFKGLRAGDPAAFHWLVEVFAGPLFRFFVVEHRDHHLAEEQTSETFAQLVCSLATVRGEPNQLPAFVFTVARRVRSRHWRSRRTIGNLEDDRAVADQRPSAAELLEQREEFERLLAAIGTMDPVVRDVLLFRYVEGCALGEVAALVGLPLGTVKSHLHRGLLRLRKSFSDSDAIHD